MTKKYNASSDSFVGRLQTVIKMAKTIQEFSVLIGVSPTTVQKWKKGNINISQENLISICEKYQINPNWLLLGIGPRYMNQVCDPDRESKYLKIILRQKQIINALVDIVDKKEIAPLVKVLEVTP